MALAALPSRVRRVVYLGTPDIAVPALQALIASDIDVAAVVTGPPRRRGRGAGPTPTPVAECAAASGIPVHHGLDALDGLDVDLGVVVAFGTILPAALLARLPMVNLHFSLLPRWRGAAPVERAILAGDQRTGVCVMQVEEGLDTGGVLASTVVDIAADAHADALASRLAEVGATLLVDTLGGPLPAPVPQEGDTVYAAKLTPGDLVLDWSEPPDVLERRVRVGGAWTTARGDRLRVNGARPVRDVESLAPGELAVDGRVLVGCRGGALELVEVVPAGRAAQSASDWARGWRPHPGERLGGAT